MANISGMQCSGRGAGGRGFGRGGFGVPPLSGGPEALIAAQQLAQVCLMIFSPQPVVWLGLLMCTAAGLCDGCDSLSRAKQSQASGI